MVQKARHAAASGTRCYVGIGAVLAVAAIACVMALFGCGQSTPSATLSQAVESDTARAMVTSVDGKTITVQVMDSNGPGGQGSGGEPPAKPEGDSSSSSSASSTSDSSNSSSNSGSNGQGGQPPAKPEGNASGQDAQGSEPPAMPEGQAPDANGQGGTPPDAPSGDAASSQASQSGSSAASQGGTPPSGASATGNAPGGMAPMGGTEMTLTVNDEKVIFTSENGQETQGSLSDLAEGTMLELSVSDGTTVTKVVASQGMGGQPGSGQGGNPPSGEQPGGSSGSSGPGHGSGTVNNGTGATTFTTDETTDGQTYESSEADQNAVRVEGGSSVALDNATVNKTGDSSSSEDSDFYGLNAALLAYDGSKLNINGGTVNTNSSGSNGVFAYGEGTEVTVSDATIRCTQGNSGGIEVAGGATLVAENLDIDTQGESSAAIRSDRGGGTETVNSGTYTTHGGHSPAVYSTADVTVNAATLTAENCEGVVIEGKNSVTLNNCDVTGNVNGVATRTGIVNNVMIYQSMSGDASEGTGSFKMAGGSYNAAHGTLFYVTNTDATIDLEDVDIQNAEGQLLVIAGNDGQWGKEGSNGGSVAFTATSQKLAGSISVDAISSLDLALKSSSSYTGAINTGGAAGTVNVTMDAGATWTLDGDSYVTSISGDTSGINLNGHTLYVNGEAWNA